VEQDHYNIVRFNGTYLHPKIHTAYLHCDSWRVNVAPSLWLPAYIYSEEPAITLDTKILAVKAQTRLWGYLASASSRQREQDSFAAVFVDPKAAVTDLAKGSLTPLESERSWERQAEDNVIERLERAELLSPPSEVDKVLQQVVTNLEASSNLAVEPEVRCRVLLTSPLESFSVGHTIFVSRGLLDVLPDEASLATILAHELAHIVLAHNSNTQFAFSDRLLVEDRETLQRLAIKRPAHEEEEADHKALELLEATSLYKDKLGPVGLFLKQMQLSQAALPHLLRGCLAESFVTTGSAARLMAAIPGVPELKAADTQQLAALPLGSRIQLNPYTDMVQMRNVSVQVLNAREKMPFQITPMYPEIAPDRLIPAVAEPAEPAAPTDRSTNGGGL